MFLYTIINELYMPWFVINLHDNFNYHIIHEQKQEKGTRKGYLMILVLSGRHKGDSGKRINITLARVQMNS